MKIKLELKEVIDLMFDFANYMGVYPDLKEFLEGKGYKLSEFGMDDAD